MRTILKQRFLWCCLCRLSRLQFCGLQKKSFCATIQLKAIEQYIHTVLFFLINLRVGANQNYQCITSFGRDDLG